MPVKPLLALILFLHIVSCTDQVTLPKPKAQLRLDFSEATYKQVAAECGFTFETNAKANLRKFNKGEQCAYQIKYPKLKATIYLSYRKVNGDLKKLLRDAQNLTQEHVIKADEIIPREFENKEARVYGTLSEVLGNAASQSQFYVTDSLEHFILGSVYFNVKPNYDSIYPAAKYLQNDMQRIMESTRWE